MAIESLNYLWILIGLVAIFMAYKVGKQKGKVMGMGKTVPVLFFLLLIGVSAYYSGLYDYVKGAEVPAAVTPPTTIVTPATTLCAVEDTTVTLAAQDIYTAAAVGEGHKYRINGAPAQSVDDAGTFTASPYDSLETLWFNASTTGAYYTDVSTETVPCLGTKTFYKSLYPHGSITLSVWNEEGVLITVADNVNETVDIGDVLTLKAELRGSYQKGVPYGAVAVCEYNDTAFDDCIIDFPGAVKTATPNSHTVIRTASKTRAYLLPPVLSNELLPGSIILDADDNGDPSALDDGADVNITIYTRNYYTDEDQGGSFEGPAVEDEDNALVGLLIYNYTLHID